MSRAVITHQAQADLMAIWSYIAVDNPEAADRVLDAIDQRCALLAENPGMGRARPNIASELRYSPVGSHLIFYRQVAADIEIVRVLHGARNVRDTLLTDE